MTRDDTDTTPGGGAVDACSCDTTAALTEGPLAPFGAIAAGAPVVLS